MAGVIFFKVNSKKINPGEKYLWDDRVKVFWQKKDWVGSFVMRDYARRFLE